MQRGEKIFVIFFNCRHNFVHQQVSIKMKEQKKKQSVVLSFTCTVDSCLQYPQLMTVFHITVAVGHNSH